MKKYKIKAPMFTIYHQNKSFKVNEYTLHNIQIAVKKGELINVLVRDCEDNISKIDANGTFVDEVNYFFIELNHKSTN